ncbi:hypothetical protein BJX76DRAFT_325794 [Aspergillus varians]
MGLVNDSMRDRESIWRPLDLSEFTPQGEPTAKNISPMIPVASPSENNFEWGVGEKSDLLTCIPIFDLVRTQWLFQNSTWGLREDVSRWVSPVAMGRISRSLAMQMNNTQSQWDIDLASERTCMTHFVFWLCFFIRLRILIY